MNNYHQKLYYRSASFYTKTKNDKNAKTDGCWNALTILLMTSCWIYNLYCLVIRDILTALFRSVYLFVKIFQWRMHWLRLTNRSDCEALCSMNASHVQHTHTHHKRWKTAHCTCTEGSAIFLTQRQWNEWKSVFYAAWMAELFSHQIVHPPHPIKDDAEISIILRHPFV